MQLSLATGLVQGGERGHCRETASGQSAEGQTTHSRAERKGAQSLSLEGESGGPAAAGGRAGGSWPTRALALRTAARGVGAGGTRPSSSLTEAAAVGKAGGWPGRSAPGQPGKGTSVRRQAQAVCLAHPNPDPSASAAALLGPRVCPGECRAQSVPGSAASALDHSGRTHLPLEWKMAWPFRRNGSCAPMSGHGGGKESSETPLRGRPHTSTGHAGWGQHSPVLDLGGGGGLAEPAAGTDSDLYRAVSRRSLKRSAAMSALDSSCRGMLLMSDEKGLSGFSRLISQLVFPGEGQAPPLRPHTRFLPWSSPPCAPCATL